MTSVEKNALIVIRNCLEADRISVTDHFYDRMVFRGLMFPDVQSAIFDDHADARDDGFDTTGRAKFVVTGAAADGVPISIVCALEETADGWTVFITLYWE